MEVDYRVQIFGTLWLSTEFSWCRHAPYEKKHIDFVNGQFVGKRWSVFAITVLRGVGYLFTGIARTVYEYVISASRDGSSRRISSPAVYPARRTLIDDNILSSGITINNMMYMIMPANAVKIVAKHRWCVPVTSSPKKFASPAYAGSILPFRGVLICSIIVISSSLWFGRKFGTGGRSHHDETLGVFRSPSLCISPYSPDLFFTKVVVTFTPQWEKERMEFENRRTVYVCVAGLQHGFDVARTGSRYWLSCRNADAVGYLVFPVLLPFA